MNSCLRPAEGVDATYDCNENVVSSGGCLSGACLPSPAASEILAMFHFARGLEPIVRRQGKGDEDCGMIRTTTKKNYPN